MLAVPTESNSSQLQPQPKQWLKPVTLILTPLDSGSLLALALVA
jgi:hypothetical protein